MSRQSSTAAAVLPGAYKCVCEQGLRWRDCDGQLTCGLTCPPTAAAAALGRQQKLELEALADRQPTGGRSGFRPSGVPGPALPLESIDSRSQRASGQLAGGGVAGKGGLPAGHGAAAAGSGSCSSSPCQHGGTCTVGQGTEDDGGPVPDGQLAGRQQGNWWPCQGRHCLPGYQCSCAMGWAGVACEVDIDECVSNPCLRGGRCGESQTDPTVWPGRFVCHCAADSTGQACEFLVLHQADASRYIGAFEPAAAYGQHLSSQHILGTAGRAAAAEAAAGGAGGGMWAGVGSEAKARARGGDGGGPWGGAGGDGPTLVIASLDMAAPPAVFGDGAKVCVRESLSDSLSL